MEGKIFFRFPHFKIKQTKTPLQDLTGDEIEEMIREADLDGDGKVLFINFLLGHKIPWDNLYTCIYATSTYFGNSWRVLC